MTWSRWERRALQALFDGVLPTEPPPDAAVALTLLHQHAPPLTVWGLRACVWVLATAPLWSLRPLITAMTPSQREGWVRSAAGGPLAPVLEPVKTLACLAWGRGR